VTGQASVAQGVGRGAVVTLDGALQGDAAVREFEEETGLKAPAITHPLKPLRQAGGKTVLCWAAEGDLDLAGFKPGDLAEMASTATRISRPFGSGFAVSKSRRASLSSIDSDFWYPTAFIAVLPVHGSGRDGGKREAAAEPPPRAARSRPLDHDLNSAAHIFG
jgi:hypothetical protein